MLVAVEAASVNGFGLSVAAGRLGHRRITAAQVDGDTYVRRAPAISN